jgi:superfamily II DNA or RNA helicase
MMTEINNLFSSVAIEPRDYQQRIVRQITDMFAGKHSSKDGAITPSIRSIMVESPTGSGKTVIGMMAAKIMQEKSIAPLGICWVAMRRNLLAQASRENVEKGFNLRNIHFTSMFDKLAQETVKLKTSGHPILLVIDECHHDATASMSHLYNIIQPNYVLGLSATPYRADKMALCFEKVIKDVGIHQLISTGYLSKFDHYTIDSWEPKIVIERYIAEPERWGKSVMFFKNLNQCYLAAQLLSSKGYLSEVVTGSSDTESQIKKFSDGKVQILINCMKLTEGFDCPSIKTVWVRNSGKGTTVQMAGRVFRIHKNTPIKQVVQGVNTSHPITKTANARMQYRWQQDRWISLTVNPLIELMAHNARMAIARTDVNMPCFISSKKTKPFIRLPFVRNI